MRSNTLELEDDRTLSRADLHSASAADVLVVNHGTGSSRLDCVGDDRVSR